MNPDQPSREQIETRITALLLGELPADEAELLRYTISRDPALKKLHDQLQSTLALVREAEQHPAEPAAEKPAPLKLSNDRRQKLLAHFQTARTGTEAPKDPLFWLKRIKVRHLVPVLTAVVIVALLAALLWPTTDISKSRGQYGTESLGLEGGVRRWYASHFAPAERASIEQEDRAVPASQVTNGTMDFTFNTRPAQVESVPAAVPPEPQLAPPPVPAQIVLPQTEPVAETVSVSQSPKGLMPADQLAAHVIAPKTSGVYTQNVVGYVDAGSMVDYGLIQSNAPRSTLNSDTFALQTAESEAVLRQAEVVQRPRIQAQGGTATPASTPTLAGQKTYNDIGISGGGGGGYGTGIGGGIGGAPATVGGNFDTGVNKDGTIATTLAENNPSSLPATASPNSALRTLAAPERNPSGPTTILPPPGAGVDLASAPNPLGQFPGAAPTAVSGELAANEPDSEESGRRYTSAVRERGTGAATTRNFYRNPTQPEEEQKVPIMGDVPLVGSLFQRMPAANASVPPPAPQAANSLAMNWNLGEPPSQPPPAGVGGSIPSEKPTAVSGLPANSLTSDHDQNGFVFNLDKGDSSQAAGTLNQTFAENKSQPNHSSTSRAIRQGFDTDESKLRMEIERFRQMQQSPSAGGAGSGTEANPEWLGLLEHPEQSQSPRNSFISRNAYIALPSTNYLALDDNSAGTVSFGPLTNSSDKEETIEQGAVDFQGIDVSEALDIYAKLTKRTLLRSALPQGQIIIQPQAPMTKAQAINELESVLAVNGVSLVNVGDKFVKAIPSDQSSGMGAEIDRLEQTNLSAPNSYVTQVVQLKYVKPSQMAQIIRPFASPTNSILPIENNGALVLRDSPERVQRMMKMIAQVDVSVPTEYISEAVPIRYAKADDIASQLTVLTGAEDQHGMPLFGQTKVIVNESSSSLLIYATRSDMEIIKTIVAKLDNEDAAAAQSDLPLRHPAPNTPVPQPEILTSSNNFSTFSMNVSDVSFKFAEASLQNNKLPDTASIRSEEFVNAFDYRDPEAAPGQPMAFNSERAQYPFAHNRDLLRFSVKAAASGRQAGRALNLVLLLDTSGSMERADRVEIIHEALRVLSAQLQPNDVVSVVSFARTARLWADGISGDKAGETLDKVGDITPEGGTNLEEAMRLAYETAHRHYLPKGMNRVVLLTDGAANLGDVNPDELKQKVDAQRKQGIALDCFGIGWEDYNDDMLEELSSNGDGRYAFLNSPEDAARDFGTKLAGALQVAAQDLKVQVEFNPQRVTAYRQIGYAKHQLTKEQFRDNTVAAGEIASQEAGNALYTIETNPNGDGPIATVRVRYRIPGTQDYQERSWDVPYTGQATALDQSSPAMRLAATASAFSEWLAASPYAQEVTPDELLKYLSGVPEIYGADDRPKQLETMIREAKSLEGK